MNSNVNQLPQMYSMMLGDFNIGRTLVELRMKSKTDRKMNPSDTIVVT